jgi:hypothetical protein
MVVNFGMHLFAAALAYDANIDKYTFFARYALS